MESVKSVTKVLVETRASVSLEKGKVHATVMGINTKEFGQVAWFKESLLATHWYEYLNMISQNANAILVSSNFQDHYGYKVGDALHYMNSTGDWRLGARHYLWFCGLLAVLFAGNDKQRQRWCYQRDRSFFDCGTFVSAAVCLGDKTVSSVD